MPTSKGRNRIRAVVRCRPITDDDYRTCSAERLLLTACVGVKSDKRTVVVTKDTFSTKELQFDQAYGIESKQEHLYEQACKDIVEDVFSGYHGSILSYGQTGSGKSYTMFGTGLDVSSERSSMGCLPGMAQLAISDLFAMMDARRRRDLHSSLQLSMFQVYKEGVSDLLAVSTHPPPAESFSLLSELEESIAAFRMNQRLLEIREYPDKSIVIEGLAHFPVLSQDDAMSLLSLGLAHRVTRAVTANEQSSRSHVILQLEFTTQESVEDGSYDQKVRTSRLLLVDLAGSERVRKSGSINDRRTLQEAQSINKSISTLGLCINTLATAGDRGIKPAHIPYRNSKLTRILAESIGGRARSCVIATVGPCLYNIEETLSTLQFAKRCAAVKKLVRRVKPVLPDLLDDSMIGWTWTSKKHSPSRSLAYHISNQDTQCADNDNSMVSEYRDTSSSVYGSTPTENLAGSPYETKQEKIISPSSPLERLFAHSNGHDISSSYADTTPLQQRDYSAYTGHTDDEAACTSSPAVDNSCARWVKYSVDHNGVSMFCPSSAASSIRDDIMLPIVTLHNGLLVLLPESAFSESQDNTVTIGRGAVTGMNQSGGFSNSLSAADVEISVRFTERRDVDKSIEADGFKDEGGVAEGEVLVTEADLFASLVEINSHNNDGCDRRADFHSDNCISSENLPAQSIIDEELRAAEELFQLYNDDNDSDGNDYGNGYGNGYGNPYGDDENDPLDEGSMNISSSSGSPISLDGLGQVSPRDLLDAWPLFPPNLSDDGKEEIYIYEPVEAARQISVATESKTPALNIATSSASIPPTREIWPDGDLLEPSDKAEPQSTLPYNDHRGMDSPLNETDEVSSACNGYAVSLTLLRPPELLIAHTVAVSGINSPKNNDRKGLSAPSADPWLNQLSSIFDGEEDGTPTHSPLRKLTSAMGTPPVIPKLEIPSGPEYEYTGIQGSDSQDSLDELGTDRSDFMAKMTDSPPAVISAALLISSPELVLDDVPIVLRPDQLKVEIDSIQSTQETIKFIMKKLDSLYADGEKKLADLTAQLNLSHSPPLPMSINHNVLSVSSSSDSSDEEQDHELTEEGSSRNRGGSSESELTTGTSDDEWERDRIKGSHSDIIINDNMHKIL